jgi:hypothetical protein
VDNRPTGWTANWRCCHRCRCHAPACARGSVPRRSHLVQATLIASMRPSRSAGVITSPGMGSLRVVGGPLSGVFPTLARGGPGQQVVLLTPRRRRPARHSALRQAPDLILANPVCCHAG